MQLNVTVNQSAIFFLFSPPPTYGPLASGSCNYYHLRLNTQVSGKQFSVFLCSVLFAFLAKKVKRMYVCVMVVDLCRKYIYIYKHIATKIQRIMQPLRQPTNKSEKF